MDLFITLDYELFLGTKTGTPENCLIRPMDELCKVAGKHNFKFVIFVDAAYLLRMSQLKHKCAQLQKDYDLVTSHIKSLVDNGHDIQLHFHPQWMYSSYNNSTCEWDLDNKHYKLSDMKQIFAFESFGAAKRLLDEIVGHKTYAFRAGGYCLDSFPEYKRLFKANNIIIDSSVARNLYENKTAHQYDYRDTPISTLYKFSNFLTKDEPTGEFIELSISSVKICFLDYLVRVRKQQKTYNPTMVYKDGVSMNSSEKVSLVEKTLRLLKGKIYLACIDGISSTMLPFYFKQTKDNTYVLIGHPKNATDDSVARLDKFLEENANAICFKTTKDLLT